MYWQLSHRADHAARLIADRHYNRQKPGTPQFVPPGRCLVLTLPSDVGRGLWVTSWPFAEFVRHEWPGAWVCSAFRREDGPRASDLIRDAVAATVAVWPTVPRIASARGEVAMVSFVDRAKTRHKRDPGRCYLRAGWSVIGQTAGGLVALGLRAEDVPEAEAALPAGGQMAWDFTAGCSVNVGGTAAEPPKSAVRSHCGPNSRGQGAEFGPLYPASE